MIVPKEPDSADPMLIGSTCGCILFPFLKMNRILPAWSNFRLGFYSA